MRGLLYLLSYRFYMHFKRKISSENIAQLAEQLIVVQLAESSNLPILPMATINQTIRHPRETFPKLKTFGALEGRGPQAKGVCLKVFIKKPRKPNSAQRKMAQVKLSLTGNIINAYIPGEGHNLEQYNVVLVRGGRTKDLPGIKYKCVRGVYDLAPVIGRKNARSKYGVKKPSLS